MDFELGDDIDVLRAQVRKFLAEHVTDEMLERVHRTGTWHDRDFARALGDRGWIAPGWPRGEGGEGRSWLEQMVLREEIDRADAPISGLSVTMLVANTIRLWGSEELKASLLPRVVRGEVVMVLGYSEAGSGSDVAAARTSAVRDGQDVDAGWVINGEKMFTTHAQVADYVFLLTRTDPTGRKRKNLTMFLVPMDTPGVGVSEVKTLGGERTNITVYQNVRVPDSARVGEVNGAWAVLSSALMFERASTWAPALDRLVDAALEATSEVLSDGSRRFADPSQRGRIARVVADAEASRLLALRAGWVAAQGEATMSEGPMAKLFSTEAYTRHAADLLDLVGHEGLRSSGPDVPRGAGVLEHAFRHSQVTTIYGGTSEIQRSIIAERGLGLPRSRA
ncbi:MAG TPA: acyl-CoA dehydrogenase family protein [Pseudonocardia sp.]|jgi:alkylation response protein AidB-like acyl-CoA dehydrogenase